MPKAAHEFFEKELKPTLVELFGELYDQITDRDEWFRIGDEGNDERIPNDCEWQDRSGFWSFNNGGVEMDFAPSTSIFGGDSSKLAPCIKEWVEGQWKDCQDEAKDDNDYKTWKEQAEADGTESDVVTWLIETSEGQEFSQSHEDSYMESTPFCHLKAWIQNPERHQHRGQVEKDTVLMLHFEFCFNDDLGYGRPSISWCPGVGDHPKCEANIFFTPADVEEVRNLLKTKIREMASCPNNETHEKVQFNTSSLGSTEPF